MQVDQDLFETLGVDLPGHFTDQDVNMLRNLSSRTAKCRRCTGLRAAPKRSRQITCLLQDQAELRSGSKQVLGKVTDERAETPTTTDRRTALRR